MKVNVRELTTVIMVVKNFVTAGAPFRPSNLYRPTIGSLELQPWTIKEVPNPIPNAIPYAIPYLTLWEDHVRLLRLVLVGTEAH
jgi:hypothetical protein